MTGQRVLCTRDLQLSSNHKAEGKMSQKCGDLTAFGDGGPGLPRPTRE